MLLLENIVFFRCWPKSISLFGITSVEKPFQKYFSCWTGSPVQSQVTLGQMTVATPLSVCRREILPDRMTWTQWQKQSVETYQKSQANWWTLLFFILAIFMPESLTVPKPGFIYCLFWWRYHIYMYYIMFVFYDVAYPRSLLQIGATSLTWRRKKHSVLGRITRGDCHFQSC